MTRLDTAYVVFGVAFGYDVVYDKLKSEQQSVVAAALDDKGLSKLWADSAHPADNNIAMVRAASLGADAAVMLGQNPAAWRAPARR